MNSTLYKMLDPTNTIEQSLPAIIEAFVLFYGEENRAYIEEKFSNTIMIGYGVPDKLRSILSKVNENITEELIENFFNKALINQNRSELKNILFGTYIDFSYMSLLPFQRYINYIEMEDKENIDSYVQSSEILIGKNIDNLKCREDIMNYYTKYKTYIPYEIGVMVLLSIITLFLGGI